MAANWTLWVCLFLSGLLVTWPWVLWRRQHRIVSERIGWLVTVLGVGVILAWLSVIAPESAWVGM